VRRDNGALDDAGTDVEHVVHPAAGVEVMHAPIDDVGDALRFNGDRGASRTVVV
jgi:hypothetical protein